MATFDATELPRIQNFLESRFGKSGFALKMRERAKDSVEVVLDGEHIGIIYKDDEDGRKPHTICT